MFQEMTDTHDSKLPFDVSYSSIAQALWEATVYHSSGMSMARAMRQGLDSYVLSGCPDDAVREAILERAKRCGITL